MLPDSIQEERQSPSHSGAIFRWRSRL